MSAKKRGATTGCGWQASGGARIRRRNSLTNVVGFEKRKRGKVTGDSYHSLGYISRGKTPILSYSAGNCASVARPRPTSRLSARPWPLTGTTKQMRSA